MRRGRRRRRSSAGRRVCEAAAKRWPRWLRQSQQPASRPIGRRRRAVPGSIREPTAGRHGHRGGHHVKDVDRDDGYGGWLLELSPASAREAPDREPCAQLRQCSARSTSQSGRRSPVRGYWSWLALMVLPLSVRCRVRAVSATTNRSLRSGETVARRQSRERDPAPRR